MLPIETVHMHLLSAEFEQAFALIEGKEHLQHSLADSGGPTSIAFVRAAFLKFVETKPTLQEKLIAIKGSDCGCFGYVPVIYGRGGWNRYGVLITGEVVFLRGPGESLDQTAYAESIGFRIR